ncbi:MAG: hypothetical protein A3E01_06995 [Gammaproteobacteria bacterium RIFCSPHIGHO2_12_FULL_63_22]|nr:MAG: hypothetical protein A3E01_06995 [Gammaproteobacteria bacterium RIFCSPHIGHO2_12_FULL_63_22]
MSDFDEAQRGQMAQSVLDNAVYADSYALIEGGLTRAWRDSRDPSEREEIHQKLLMLDKVKNLLESVMRTGQLAEDKIRQQKSQAERMADAAWKRKAQ